jgi:ABC-type multidrug transport system ATPase subunit
MELRIEHLSKRYANGTQALDDVSLTIPPGLFGLLGPNGAGKSTLMRTLATLQDVDAGSVRLGEVDVLTQGEALRRQLGYLPQDFGVYPRVSALALLEHVAVLKGLAPAKARREQVHALLEKVNLHPVRHQRLGGFSGGMRQRFGIAQALLGAPRLLIVDEPTAGLDPEERVRFHNLLAEVGRTVVVILSTHIVADVSELCPRMAILDRGRVRFQGEPDRAVAEVRGRIWRKVLGPDERADQVEGRISTRLSQGRTVVHVWAEARPGAGYEAKEPDLEDAYFAAIHGHLGGAEDAPCAAVEGSAGEARDRSRV